MQENHKEGDEKQKLHFANSEKQNDEDYIGSGTDDQFGQLFPLMMMDDLLSEVGKKLWQIIMKTMSNIWMQLAVKVKLLHI